MGYPREKPLDDYILKLEELTHQMRVENRKVVEGTPHEKMKARHKIAEILDQMETLGQTIRRKIGG